MSTATQDKVVTGAASEATKKQTAQAAQEAISAAKQAAEARSEQIEAMHSALQQCDVYSQMGFKTIKAMALGIDLMLQDAVRRREAFGPTANGYESEIGDLLEHIRYLADDMCNCINVEAESQGASFQDPGAGRLYNPSRQYKTA